MPHRPIGIFDSGIGGLTVLRAALRRLPGESFVYLGDTARVPYGTKGADTVIRYAEQAAAFLVSHGVKMLVVACNTASAVALPHLARRFRLPVVGVIEPGARQACRQSRTGAIGVIGTEGTVGSGAYDRAILRLRPDARVLSAACPLFVPLTEEGWSGHPVADICAREYLAPLQEAGIDSLVLGCTHYPLLKPVLKRILGDGIILVDSAEATADAIAGRLLDAELASAGTVPREGRTRFYVTDLPDRFRRVGSTFLGTDIGEIEQIDIGIVADDSRPAVRSCVAGGWHQ
ncbi:glutamate racemase [Geothermobacter ehrlichii]|uniref:Glutamate racemase n=1 Tax=Geothermobacter ehrlichii TaxID=213224 RepID=A0A5D3WIW6_9BACT|nr:glutamate racemase [Geothermobacter ehrlichii]TYO97139.1 glutamate racemase [Geothermobacter ehrlichii]